jgi:hypothetical protein
VLLYSPFLQSSYLEAAAECRAVLVGRCCRDAERDGACCIPSANGAVGTMIVDVMKRRRRPRRRLVQWGKAVIANLAD